MLPASPPALRVSDFVRLMQLTTLEPEGGALSRDAILKAPFAFVFAPDLLAGAIDLYVAPARLLEDASAWAWRIELRGRGADARRLEDSARGGVGGETAVIRTRFADRAGDARGPGEGRHFIVGMTNSAPSLMPDGQREVTVLVLV